MSIPLDNLSRYLDRLIQDGDIRLELIAGVPVWETLPSIRHQAAIDRIRSTIAPRAEHAEQCGCHHFSDILIRFPDGSFRRPDIAIFCQRPPETDDALTWIPAAVIEVVSAGYEMKDLTIGPPHYLTHGVQDVVVYDPRSGVTIHSRTTGVQTSHAPVTIDLACGCRCRLPPAEPPPT